MTQQTDPADTSKDAGLTDEEVKRLLGHPKVQAHIAASQASRDREIVSLKERINRIGQPEDVLLDALEGLSKGRGGGGNDDADPLETVRNKLLRGKAEKEAAAVREQAHRVDRAKSMAKKFAEHGVHMEDLIDLDEDAMQDYCIERVKESLAKSADDRSTTPPPSGGDGTTTKRPDDSADKWEGAAKELIAIGK